MRKCTFLAVVILFFTPQLAQSQLELSTTNIATQEGTATTKKASQVLTNASQSEVRYYYYPNLQVYYDRQKGCYHFRRIGKQKNRN
jgi:ribosome-binding factor A